MTVDDVIITLRKGLTHPELSELCKLLGVQYTRWARLLAQSMLYSDVTGPMVEATVQAPLCSVPTAAGADNDRLILSQKGAPCVGVPFIQHKVWPYDPVVVAAYESEAKVRIEYGGHVYLADCVVAEGRLVVAWPAELNIVGDIDLTDLSYEDGFSVTLATVPSYPVVDALKLVRESGEIFKLPDTYVSAAITVGKPADSLAIIAYALYKTLHGGH